MTKVAFNFRTLWPSLLFAALAGCGGGGGGGGGGGSATTYAISGTVTGLQAGSSVVLQDNGSDNVSVAGNGSFGFPTHVASGMAYSVTVSTQPTGQTCVVSNGSGTVGSANIGNIAVTCSLSHYTIGALISGLLANTSLVLQDNSADDVTASNNGGINFPTAIASGTTYAVTVQKQPTAQTCSVTNGTGTVAGTNVTVAVTCAARGSATLTAVAGNMGGAGDFDGTGSAARFNVPVGVAIDAAGNLFVSDAYNETIRMISPAGSVTTFAGAAGSPGTADGSGPAARFNTPGNIATDTAGNVYIADASSNTIRKITPAGIVSTLAGSAGIAGALDGTGTAAEFFNPLDVAADNAGNVYVADCGNQIIRKITAAGVVSTLAGAAGVSGSADGTGSAANFWFPSGITVDSSGNLFVADSGNNTIREITPAGVVTTVAGMATMAGSVDGTGAIARFSNPSAVALDGAGNIYVADSGNSTIREITPAGTVTTFAGAAGVSGSADGIGPAATFNSPFGIKIDNSGNLIVADTLNNTVRKITPGAVVSTIAGSPSTLGSADATGAAATFNFPFSSAVDSAGNLYVADVNNHTIRKVTAAGVATTFAGMAGVAGSADGSGSAARFDSPHGVAVDGADNIYVADTGNETIRKITPAGVVTTLAGTADIGGSADGAGGSALFNYPAGIGVDATGNLYVADNGNNTIRKITPGGVVTTLAGQAGMAGSADGAGAAARFTFPIGVAVDGANNIYVADYATNAIRMITPSGVVSTLAGNPTAPGANTDGSGSSARFSGPSGVAVDGFGNVYVADTLNHTIRKVAGGVVTTIAGTPSESGFVPGPLPGVLIFPTGVALKGSTLYVTLSNGIAAIQNVP